MSAPCHLDSNRLKLVFLAHPPQAASCLRDKQLCCAGCLAAVEKHSAVSNTEPLGGITAQGHTALALALQFGGFPAPVGFGAEPLAQMFAAQLETSALPWKQVGFPAPVTMREAEVRMPAAPLTRTPQR